MHQKLKISHVDENRCGACEMCVKVCPNGCFAIVEDNGKIVSKHIDADKCTKCGACLKACPKEAIVLSTANNKEEYYISLDHNKCEACGECEKICPECGFEIIHDSGKVHSKRGKADNCRGGHHCVFICKHNAIKLEKK